MQLDHRVLLIDKPAGASSFAAVRAVRRAAGLAKVGHCGSLDPLATGLLVLCTGAATRVAGEFVALSKRYEARVRLGRATDSYDADGRVTEEGPVPRLDAARVRDALQRFTGEIEQRPPMVSAVKVQGRRLYTIARQGGEVERAPRRVQVYGLDLVQLGESHVDLRVHCGRGCYVRSIAHELGQALGVPAHLEALRRVGIGELRVEAAIAPAAVEAGARDPSTEAVARLRSAVLDVDRALAFLPVLKLRPDREAALRQGVQPGLTDLVLPPESAGRHRLQSADGSQLLALVDVDAGRATLRTGLVFRTPLAVGEGAVREA